jgi:hypothetical protein
MWISKIQSDRIIEKLTDQIVTVSDKSDTIKKNTWSDVMSCLLGDTAKTHNIKKKITVKLTDILSTMKDWTKKDNLTKIIEQIETGTLDDNNGKTIDQKSIIKEYAQSISKHAEKYKNFNAHDQLISLLGSEEKKQIVSDIIQTKNGILDTLIAKQKKTPTDATLTTHIHNLTALILKLDSSQKAVVSKKLARIKSSTNTKSPKNKILINPWWNTTNTGWWSNTIGKDGNIYNITVNGGGSVNIWWWPNITHGHNTESHISTWQEEEKLKKEEEEKLKKEEEEKLKKEEEEKLKKEEEEKLKKEEEEKLKKEEEEKLKKEEEEKLKKEEEEKLKKEEEEKLKKEEEEKLKKEEEEKLKKEEEEKLKKEEEEKLKKEEEEKLKKEEEEKLKKEEEEKLKKEEEEKLKKEEEEKLKKEEEEKLKKEEEEKLKKEEEEKLKKEEEEKLKKEEEEKLKKEEEEKLKKEEEEKLKKEEEEKLKKEEEEKLKKEEEEKLTPSIFSTDAAVMDKLDYVYQNIDRQQVTISQQKHAQAWSLKRLGMLVTQRRSQSNAISKAISNYHAKDLLTSSREQDIAQMVSYYRQTQTHNIDNGKIELESEQSDPYINDIAHQYMLGLVDQNNLIRLINQYYQGRGSYLSMGTMTGSDIVQRIQDMKQQVWPEYDLFHNQITNRNDTNDVKAKLKAFCTRHARVPQGQTAIANLWDCDDDAKIDLLRQQVLVNATMGVAWAIKAKTAEIHIKKLKNTSIGLNDSTLSTKQGIRWKIGKVLTKWGVPVSIAWAIGMSMMMPVWWPLMVGSVGMVSLLQYLKSHHSTLKQMEVEHKKAIQSGDRDRFTQIISDLENKINNASRLQKMLSYTSFGKLGHYHKQKRIAQEMLKLKEMNFDHLGVVTHTIKTMADVISNINGANTTDDLVDTVARLDMEFDCDTHFISGQGVDHHSQDRQILMQTLENKIRSLNITMDEVRWKPLYHTLCNNLRQQHQQFIKSIHSAQTSMSLKDAARSGFTSFAIAGTIRWASKVWNSLDIHNPLNRWKTDITQDIPVTDINYALGGHWNIDAIKDDVASILSKNTIQPNTHLTFTPHSIVDATQTHVGTQFNQDRVQSKINTLMDSLTTWWYNAESIANIKKVANIDNLHNLIDRYPYVDSGNVHLLRWRSIDSITGFVEGVTQSWQTNTTLDINLDRNAIQAQITNQGNIWTTWREIWWSLTIDNSTPWSIWSPVSWNDQPWHMMSIPSMISTHANNWSPTRRHTTGPLSATTNNTRTSYQPSLSNTNTNYHPTRPSINRSISQIYTPLYNNATTSIDNNTFISINNQNDIHVWDMIFMHDINSQHKSENLKDRIKKSRNKKAKPWYLYIVNKHNNGNLTLYHPSRWNKTHTISAADVADIMSDHTINDPVLRPTIMWSASIAHALDIKDHELTRGGEKSTNNSYREKSIQWRKYFNNYFTQSNITIDSSNFKKMLCEMHRISAYKDSNIAKIWNIRTCNIDSPERGRAVALVDKLAHKHSLGDVSVTNTEKAQYAKASKLDTVLNECAEYLYKVQNKFRTWTYNDQETLDLIAEYYHTAVYARPMGNVNNSMFMNQVNYLLKLSGREGISHGQLDHIACRVSKEHFKILFAKYLAKTL